jgi:hypothetical protein
MRTSEKRQNPKYDCARLRGFEASGCLLGSLAAGPMYQALLRQSSKLARSKGAEGSALVLYPLPLRCDTSSVICSFTSRIAPFMCASSSPRR